MENALISAALLLQLRVVAVSFFFARPVAEAADRPCPAKKKQVYQIGSKYASDFRENPLMNFIKNNGMLLRGLAVILIELRRTFSVPEIRLKSGILAQKSTPLRRNSAAGLRAFCGSLMAAF